MRERTLDAMRIAILLLAAALAGCSADGRPVDRDGIPAQCGTAPDAGRPQFIVGYGSLMQEESRMRTSPQAGPVHPVEVHGYRRGWFARSQPGGLGTTFLGAVANPAGHFNAIVYQVNEAELLATDRRESSYCRAIVPMPDVTPYERDFAPPPNAQTWIYAVRDTRPPVPDPLYPIVQSYVDIFLVGCLEQEQRFGLPDFARQCIATTEDWSEHWVNDRIYPRRPFIYQPRARQIDGLLATQLPDYFHSIRIEGGR